MDDDFVYDAADAAWNTTPTFTHAFVGGMVIPLQPGHWERLTDGTVDWNSDRITVRFAGNRVEVWIPDQPDRLMPPRPSEVRSEPG